jgi:DNA-binding LytR/AlgR family response regulator
MHLNCVVIDDEPNALALIKKYVSKIPFLNLTQASCDAEEAKSFLENNSVDLLFADIKMFTSANLLDSLVYKPIIIFISAYKKYALKGFDLGALDYLLKPLDFERFSTAASRAIDLFSSIQSSKQDEENYLFVRSGHKTVRIELNQIEYIEGFVNYIRIHLVNARPILSLTTLKSILQKLPPGKFRRIHRSFIIAIARVKEVQAKRVMMHSSKLLPISNSYADFNKELGPQE